MYCSGRVSIAKLDINFWSVSFALILIDMEDLKQFCQTQGAPDANDLSHWDVNFWSERLRESKYEINEV